MMSSDKWEAILNKCSSDLTLLIFEESKKEKEFLQAEITDNTIEIAGSSDDQLKSTLAETLEKELKLMTFKRDEKTTNWEEFTHGVPNKDKERKDLCRLT